MASPAPEDSMVLEPTAVPEPEPRLRTSERRSRAAQARRDARFSEAARLREQGLSIRAVALTLGVERKTVRRWLRAGHAPTWRHADRGSSILDPHRTWLEERWQAGCRNTAALWRDLKGRGFPGQYSTVRAWGTWRRRQDPAVEPAGASRTSRLVKMLEPPTPRLGSAPAHQRVGKTQQGGPAVRHRLAGALHHHRYRRRSHRSLHLHGEGQDACGPRQLAA